MPAEFDVYRDWLGIADPNRPLNYYQLLRLTAFEDDAVKIRERYRKLNAHVRKYAAGDFAAQSQNLLSELSKAMLCLTDARRKSEYDATLGRKDDGSGRRRTLEEILLLRKVLDEGQLAKARSYAAAVGVDVRDAVVQQRLAKSELVMPAYAESIGLAYIELSDIQIDPALAAQVPAILARQHSLLPVMIDDRQLLVASPNQLDPNAEEELRLRFNMPVRTVLCTPAGINELIQQYYSRDLAAAEKAGGGFAAAGKAAKPADAADSAAAPELDPKQAAELKKRNLGISGMAFLTGFLGYQFTHKSGVVTMLIGLAIGLSLGGVMFAVLLKLKK